MARPHPTNRRRLVHAAPPPPPPPLPLLPPPPPRPPSQVVDPGRPLFMPPPGMAPDAPAGYFRPRGFGFRPGAGRQDPVFVQNPNLPPKPPLFFMWNPAVLMRLDEQRTRSLLTFIADEGLEPSPEDELKRKHVISQLKQIVLEWIKKVAMQRGLPNDVVDNTSATILTYGSYGLGVHGSESDIDALCVGPQFATLKDDFFVVLCNMLESRQEISDIHCVKSARVPLMRFKFNGISVDFPYTRLPVISVPEDVDIFDRSFSGKLDETSWRSLSGVRANKRILQLVPNIKKFQCMLRCVKLWARRRGIYGHSFGFFGGIHLAILSAFVCQKHPNASLSMLISLFFKTFSFWRWPEPVTLQDKFLPYRFPDSHSLMPIMMPCKTPQWCYSNITKSTYEKIMSEFFRGYMLTRDPQNAEFRWTNIFEPFPYSLTYSRFLRIFLAAPSDDELQVWAGWIKSRFRSLVLKLEELSLYCDPNPTEYVDHNMTELHTVFYWGLFSHGEGRFVNLENLKEEFMKVVNNDLYSVVRSSGCKMDLSIIQRFQLPKNLQAEVVEGTENIG